MCGICGFAGKADEELARAMTRSMLQESDSTRLSNVASDPAATVESTAMVATPTSATWPRI